MSAKLEFIVENLDIISKLYDKELLISVIDRKSVV